jgi:hypothetical protein
VIPEEVQKAFSSILNIEINPDKQSIPYNGCFQAMRAVDQKRSYVHADTSAHWAALVYLSKRTEPSGGTSFFQHKPTGLTHFPESAELQKVIRKDRSSPSKWMEIDRVGYVYNRFVLYDAQLFHKNGKTWGTRLTTARLTHNFFV